MPRRPPRTSSAIHPPITYARAYERALRRNILDPIVQHFIQQIRLAGHHNQAIQLAVAQLPAHLNSGPNLTQLITGIATTHIQRLERYHARRFQSIMRIALGLKVFPRAHALHLEQIMLKVINDNVDLIKTIPTRYHTRLKADMAHLLDTHPFDEHAVTTKLRQTYKSSGYNLRRLSRDQTNKTIGKFTEARQTRIGVQRYQWRTASDERVRPSHQSNDGRIFRWDSPPSTGHPGYEIQCRCVALAVIDPPNRPLQG